MIYDNNEKLKSYIRWKFEQKNILSHDFNINLIYLFDLHNINTDNIILYFEIYSFSYCPINISKSFNILFGQYKSYCLINESNNMEKIKQIQFSVWKILKKELI